MFTLSCLRRRNLMSPPTDSQGPTEAITSTEFLLHSSNACDQRGRGGYCKAQKQKIM